MVQRTSSSHVPGRPDAGGGLRSATSRESATAVRATAGLASLLTLRQARDAGEGQAWSPLETEGDLPRRTEEPPHRDITACCLRRNSLHHFGLRKARPARHAIATVAADKQQVIVQAPTGTHFLISFLISFLMSADSSAERSLCCSDRNSTDHHRRPG